ncbi:tyrosine-type recombinase/integrase [Methylobacterium aquaticum]|uniref:Site-specific recombinase XerD n=1 Tax=Methylobacterium aquaticum TaxID=270351 RepID=A0A0C6FKY2_9HYPH|nr:tyrosine-type recombinase/integrase [Methylobacterium aquaticum]BAQ45804.1 site-specific recombinase XerD [Methylobacterium aquaticum]
MAEVKRKPNPKKAGAKHTSGPAKGKWVYWSPSKGRWDFDYTLWKKRHFGDTGCTRKDEAERFAREHRDEQIAHHVRVHGKPGIPGKQRDAPLETAVDRFYAERMHLDVGHAGGLYMLHNVVDVLGEKTMLSAIDDDAVVRLIGALENLDVHGDPARGKIGEDRVNAHVKVLRRLMRYAVGTWKFYLPDMPDWPRHMLADAPRKREAGFAELDRIAEEWREDYWPALEFLYEGAQRLTNSVELTWGQVDFVTGVIRFNVKAPATGRGRKRRDVEDRRKPSEIPITPALERILRTEWERPDRHETAVFTYVSRRAYRCPGTGRSTERGVRCPLRAQTFRSYWERVRARIGIKDLRIHDLRRTRGSLMLRATGDITKVQALLKHADIKTTSRHYAHVVPADLYTAMVQTNAYVSGLRARFEAAQGVPGPSPVPTVGFSRENPGADPAKGLSHEGDMPFSSMSHIRPTSLTSFEGDAEDGVSEWISDCGKAFFRPRASSFRPFVINIHLPGPAPDGSLMWRNFRRNPGAGDEPMMIQLPGFPRNPTELINAFAQVLKWRPIRRRLLALFEAAADQGVSEEGGNLAGAPFRPDCDDRD